MLAVQLLDKHGEVVGLITYSAAAHLTVGHEGQQAHQAWQQQHLQQVARSSSESEQRSLTSERSSAEACHINEGAFQAMLMADAKEESAAAPKIPPSQPSHVHAEAAELRNVESEAFIYSSTGSLHSPCYASFELTVHDLWLPRSSCNHVVAFAACCPTIG